MKPQGARQREGASERERERGIERVRKKTPQRESQTRDVIKQVLFQFSGEPQGQKGGGRLPGPASSSGGEGQAVREGFPWLLRSARAGPSCAAAYSIVVEFHHLSLKESGFLGHLFAQVAGKESVSKHSKGKLAKAAFHLPGVPLLRLVCFGQWFTQNSHTPDWNEHRQWPTWREPSCMGSHYTKAPLVTSLLKTDDQKKLLRILGFTMSTMKNQIV